MFGKNGRIQLNVVKLVYTLFSFQWPRKNLGQERRDNQEMTTHRQTAGTNSPCFGHPRSNARLVPSMNEKQLEVIPLPATRRKDSQFGCVHTCGGLSREKTSPRVGMVSYRWRACEMAYSSIAEPKDWSWRLGLMSDFFKMGIWAKTRPDLRHQGLVTDFFKMVIEPTNAIIQVRSRRTWSARSWIARHDCLYSQL